MTRGFVIGATGSGTGKTTISLAILACLKDMGYTVAPFKVGPDFIDPGHHANVCGQTSYNLDSWMLPKAYNQTLFDKKTKNADIAVVEGVMGLFDGLDGTSEAGSTAQMAKWLDLPVVLVISAKGKARSAAAIVKGFEIFDPNLKIAGVIFSKTGSMRHYQYLKAAVEEHCTTPCLGYMPRNESIVMPERHLGLVTAQEAKLNDETMSILSTMVKDHIDLSGLIDRLDNKKNDNKQNEEIHHFERQEETYESLTLRENSPTIAVAKDKAFCFYYPDNLEMLEQFGAKIVYFSPLSDDQLPDNIDGIYFGGGYPEVHAQILAQKTQMLEQINQYSKMGMPIYGECGGFMVLCHKLSGMDTDHQYHMSGCFDFSVQMSGRLRSLGYREITLKKDTIIGKKGQVLRGHEFHYSSLENPDTQIQNIYDVTSRVGQDIQLKGYQDNNTLGSYLHLHFGSNPACAQQFVATCKRFKDSRK